MNEIELIKNNNEHINSIFTFVSQGDIEIQEDLTLIFTHDDYSCFFIFDGHSIKNTKKNKLILYLKEDFENQFHLFFQDKKINNDILLKFFTHIDKLIFDKKLQEGSCLSFVILNNHLCDFFYGNLGDCCVTFLTKDDEIIMTESHNFTSKSEISRYIKQNLAFLIKNKRFKGINVSRALGDSNVRLLYDYPFNGIPSIYHGMDIKEIKKIILFSDGLEQKNELSFNDRLIPAKDHIKQLLNKIQLDKDYLSSIEYHDNTSCIILELLETKKITFYEIYEYCVLDEVKFLEERFNTIICQS